MVAKIFTDMLADASAAGIDARSRASKLWFRKKAQEFTKINVPEIMRTSGTNRVDDSGKITKPIRGGREDRYRTVVQPGTMYLFSYDPKHKSTLPYYDLYPLIFPIAVEKDSILGINLHYLSPKLRGQLMDALYKYVTSPRLSEKDKLRITYGILKSASEFPLVKPCIKRYLKPHIRSRFVQINPEEWEFAAFLGIDKFQKKGRTTVWAESAKIANKGKTK